MIDTHCHLEVMDNYDEVIQRAKAAGLNAIISPATEPKSFEKGLKIMEENKGFVFLGAGIHPEYIKDITEEDIEKAFNWIRINKDNIVGIGEQGLDYFWIKEESWREKQKELFRHSIELTKELDKVNIVHTRDAYEDTVKILEKEAPGRVQLHMWGEHKFTDAINDNGWFVSVGPIAARSKKHKKVVRDTPIEQLMLETDSPWFGGKSPDGKLLGEPTNIKIPAEKIAEVKEMTVEEVMQICAKNAEKLFKLK
jgi:TatD DNase family protein